MFVILLLSFKRLKMRSAKELARGVPFLLEHQPAFNAFDWSDS